MQYNCENCIGEIGFWCERLTAGYSNFAEFASHVVIANRKFGRTQSTTGRPIADMAFSKVNEEREKVVNFLVTLGCTLSPEFIDERLKNEGEL